MDIVPVVDPIDLKIFVQTESDLHQPLCWTGMTNSLQEPFANCRAGDQCGSGWTRIETSVSHLIESGTRKVFSGGSALLPGRCLFDGHLMAVW